MMPVERPSVFLISNLGEIILKRAQVASRTTRAVLSSGSAFQANVLTAAKAVSGPATTIASGIANVRGKTMLNA